MRQAWQIKKPSRRSSPGLALGSTEGLGRAGSGTPCWLQGNPAHGAAGASAAGKPIQQLTSAKIQATSKPGACEVLAPHGGPGITRCCNCAGPGGEGAFPTNPALQQWGKKEKNKTQERFSSWLSKPCANFQRIYGILKFSPSAEHFSKTKHLHPLRAGRGRAEAMKVHISLGKRGAPAPGWIRRQWREVNCLL